MKRTPSRTVFKKWIAATAVGLNFSQRFYREQGNKSIDSEGGSSFLLPRVALRTSGNSAGLTEAVQSAAAFGSTFQVVDIQNMEDLVAGRLDGERRAAQLAGLFSALALFLSCVGLYGATSFGVNQRKREIGIRMALGAEGSSVVGMVLAEALWVVGIGVVAGLGGTLAASRTLSAFLFGLTPMDPLKIAAVSLLLIVVATLAAGLPAMRASRIDPMVVLRHE